MRLMLVDDEATVHGDYKIEMVTERGQLWPVLHMEGSDDVLYLDELELDIVKLYHQGVK